MAVRRVVAHLTPIDHTPLSAAVLGDVGLFVGVHDAVLGDGGKVGHPRIADRCPEAPPRVLTGKDLAQPGTQPMSRGLGEQTGQF